MSKIKDVCCKPRLHALVNLFLEYSQHVTVPIRSNLTGNTNANWYRTDTERVREWEWNGYRADTEGILNGYRMDTER